MDVIREAFEAIRGRSLRSSLTILGVAFGILALVATLGLTATAGAQVTAQFDALKATSVEIGGFSAPQLPRQPGTGLLPPAISADALMRAQRLNGVVAVGVTATTTEASPAVSRLDARTPSAAVQTPVMAASAGALAAMRLETLSGRLFDQGDDDRQERVVLLGQAVATDMGISSVDGSTLIYISGLPYLLAGIVTAPDFDSTAPLSAIVPDWVTRDTDSGISFGAPSVMIETRMGAAQQVGEEAPLALQPTAPGQLVAQVPPSPQQLQHKVETADQALFLALGGVCLLIGAIGIGNTTLVAVLERRHEIGLRRAIGAARRTILVQFLLESGGLGLLGGIVGTVAGLNLTIGIALSKEWTAAVAPWSLVAGPLLGVAVGVIAGIYPAVKAALLEPVSALAA